MSNLIEYIKMQRGAGLSDYQILKNTHRNHRISKYNFRETPEEYNRKTSKVLNNIQRVSNDYEERKIRKDSNGFNKSNSKQYMSNQFGGNFIPHDENDDMFVEIDDKGPTNVFYDAREKKFFSSGDDDDSDDIPIDPSKINPNRITGIPNDLLPEELKGILPEELKGILPDESGISNMPEFIEDAIKDMKKEEISQDTIDQTIPLMSIISKDIEQEIEIPNDKEISYTDIENAEDSTNIPMKEQDTTYVLSYVTIVAGTVLYYPSSDVQAISGTTPIFVKLPEILDMSKQRSFTLFFTPNLEYARRFAGIQSLNKRDVYVHKLIVVEDIPTIKRIDGNLISKDIDNVDLGRGFCGPSIDGEINGIQIIYETANGTIEEDYICNPERFMKISSTEMQIDATSWVNISDKREQIHVGSNPEMNLNPEMDYETEINAEIKTNIEPESTIADLGIEDVFQDTNIVDEKHDPMKSNLVESNLAESDLAEFDLSDSDTE